MLSALYTVLVLLAIGVVLWAIGRLLVNHWVGLRGRVRVPMGDVVRMSGWGTADVNGIGFMESVRVVECERGWLVQLHWILGGGKLWLPRGQTHVTPPDENDRSLADSALLESGPQRVRLEGDLAEFIAAPPPRTQEKRVRNFIRGME
ncbi:MAG TPA: hypothetical protein VFB80_24685 [Pirellulaceae bacterium]|nr:hypothetical protein [Pirellulaceae bacterium]